MTLFIQSRGVGPDVVLLHGWGFHSGVWDDLLETLIGWGYRVHTVDLPGHGHSLVPILPLDVDGWAQMVLATVPAGATWVGWSLGGMLALAAATLNPDSIRSLVLVGASPRFIRGVDWPVAVAPELLAEFALGIRGNWHATLVRFLAIQARSNSSQTVRHLRAAMLALPPDPLALANGLAILQETDLRSRLLAVTCPTLVLLGELDNLVPMAISTELNKLCPAWQIRCLPGAGHLPFITHRAAFLAALQEFG